MNTVDVTRYKKMKFKTIVGGEVFVNPENDDVYMGLSSPVFKPDGSGSLHEFQAVNLINGTMAQFDPDDMVYITHTTLEYQKLPE